MRHWLRDQHFRSLLKNSSYLGLSQIVAAVTSLATLAFAGRSLGVELFGLLILIHAYVDAASNLTKFQSWQLVVRYGGQVLVSDDPSDFKAATGFSIGVSANAWEVFSLIDIMVGLVIGLIAILVIYQVFAASEGIKRNTTSIGDDFDATLRYRRHHALQRADKIARIPE